MHIDIKEGNPPETGGLSYKSENESTGKDENKKKKEEKELTRQTLREISYHTGTGGWSVEMGAW